VTHATDIVGYTYQADTYCPPCALAAVMARYYPNAPREDSTAPGFDVHRSIAGRIVGLGVPWADDSRYGRVPDETMYDSDDAPKVIFASQMTDCESTYCATCETYMGGTIDPETGEPFHTGHFSRLGGTWWCDTCDSPYCDLA
jgi:hypothetical protein